MDVRTLTNNFQKMLAQATKEIKKLDIQKTKLEKEEDTFAFSEYRACYGNREKKVTKMKSISLWSLIGIKFQGLLAANEEFVEEVKRLYREEEILE